MWVWGAGIPDLEFQVFNMGVIQAASGTMLEVQLGGSEAETFAGFVTRATLLNHAARGHFRCRTQGEGL